MSGDLVRLYARAIKYRFRFSAPEVRFLHRHLRPGQTAVDVGAYKGAYTFWMWWWVRPRGHVYAFEPQPLMADYLERVSRWMKGLHVEKTALSSRIGFADLFVPAVAGQVSQCATIEAPVGDVRGYVVPSSTTTLDAYFAPRDVRSVALVKCDAEEHELSVLRGGERLLRESHPALLVESNVPGPERDELFGFLENLGYRGYYFDAARGGAETAVDNPDCVRTNNFAFLFADGSSHDSRAGVERAAPGLEPKRGARTP